MQIIAFETTMLSVVMLNVVIMSVAMPFTEQTQHVKMSQLKKIYSSLMLRTNKLECFPF
jgi:hypothetical protein